MSNDLTTTGLIIAGGQQALIAAKEFATKLLSPSIEEVGLILKDEVAVYRFKNQIRLLAKTKAICEASGISPKAISPKLLLPLIDYASLEDDVLLQDKWATLLSNLVDSEQNIDNHVLPYVLSQISKNEFMFLEGKIISDADTGIVIKLIEIADTVISTILPIERSNLLRLALIERRLEMDDTDEISISISNTYYITELGVLFIKACTEKINQ